ncbi:transporter [Baekduia soli]|uniref:Transporter n=1 Tax=Baekduia soli TaxID=496014 RepID=A0A5B8U132_9ACTN|nr:transporter [Baekduia soli]QEC46701.1 transporter [Baekduia soli]
MALVVLAIIAATAVGVAAERRHGAAAVALAHRLITIMVWGLLPFIAFFVIARLHLGGGVGIGLVLGYAGHAILGTLAYLIGTRVLHLSRPSTGTLVLNTVLVNTGFLGIPLTATLLGHDALAPAVAWDTLVSLVMTFTVGFAVGAAFGTKAGERPRDRVRAFLTRNPVLWALVAALVAPDALAPDALVEIAKNSTYALLPIGFFVLGVHLTVEREGGALAFPPPLTRPVLVVMVLRHAAAPALLVGLSALTVDVPDAYIVEAGMASAINSLIVSHLYGLDVRLAASAVAWTSAFAVTAAVVLSLVL